ncbi:hypothetical protein PINS_up000525 [Pythium insidiosum]|nr:hypothetical protein PINS_up000525 [Pythium insidiosum]
MNALRKKLGVGSAQSNDNAARPPAPAPLPPPPVATLSPASSSAVAFAHLHQHNYQQPPMPLSSSAPRSTGSSSSSPFHADARRKSGVAWVPDSLAERCYKCHAAFSLMLRRHHCRRCGNVFCDACSQSRLPLVSAGFHTPVRVCDKCCGAAKRAHARLVEERQQQWMRQYHTALDESLGASTDLQQQPRHHRSEPSSAAGIGPPPYQQRALSQSVLVIPAKRRPFGDSEIDSAPLSSSTPSARPSPLLGGSVLLDPRYYQRDMHSADPDDELDDEDRKSLERRVGLGADREYSLRTLPGETVLVCSENVRAWTPRQQQHDGSVNNAGGTHSGTLYVTNFRLIFSPYISAVKGLDGLVDTQEDDEDTADSVREDRVAAATLQSEALLAYQAIPLFSVERLKRKETVETDSGTLDLVTKDFRHVRFYFDGLVAKQTFNQFDRTVQTVRHHAFGEPHGIVEPFARVIAGTEYSPGWRFDAVAEFARLGVSTPSSRWRLSPINASYELCPTYPALLAVPSSVPDDVLAIAAKFRSKGRIPALSWRDTRSGAVICRSSQPLVGLGQRQCDKDVRLIQAIAATNPSSRRLVIIDARPWKNAVAQKTVGRAGYELTAHYETRHAAGNGDVGAAPPASTLSPPSRQAKNESDDEDDEDADDGEDEDDGQSTSTTVTTAVSDRIRQTAMAGESADAALVLSECKLIFMGIENIHLMRKSYTKLLELCTSAGKSDKWLEQLAATRWMEHLAKILDSALEIVRLVARDRSSVLVHCSDGWDRTAQLTSLAQLLLDPFYRTIEGFAVLVEKEWCSFGHKFRERLGHGINGSSSSEVSPVFLQFIDCVWQLTRQFPTAFEFHERFLIVILDQLYAGRVGTFLYDSECERQQLEARHPTPSLWTYLHSMDRELLVNPLYIPPNGDSGDPETHSDEDAGVDEPKLEVEAKDQSEDESINHDEGVLADLLDVSRGHSVTLTRQCYEVRSRRPRAPNGLNGIGHRSHSSPALQRVQSSTQSSPRHRLNLPPPLLSPTSSSSGISSDHGRDSLCSNEAATPSRAELDDFLTSMHSELALAQENIAQNQYEMVRDLDFGLEYPRRHRGPTRRHPSALLNIAHIPSSPVASVSVSPSSPRFMMERPLRRNRHRQTYRKSSTAMDVLYPCTSMRSLQFWSRYYLRWDPSSTREREAAVEVEAIMRETHVHLARQRHVQAQNQRRSPLSPTPSEHDAAVQTLLLQRQRALDAVQREFEDALTRLELERAAQTPTNEQSEHMLSD